MQIFPPRLIPDKSVVELVAPARCMSIEELKPFTTLLESCQISWIAPHLPQKPIEQYFLSDTERINMLQSAIQNPNSDAIWCVRGGYGTLKIVDALDFSPLIHKTKWLIGYSDITALHGLLHQKGLMSLHAAMPVNTTMDVNPQNLQQAIEFLLHPRAYTIEVANTDPLNQEGFAKGQLIGGNLSLLANMVGTANEFDYKDKILFIEELDEYLYHVDRLITFLKRTGRLAQVQALVVGGLTEMKDNPLPFGKTAPQIIHEAFVSTNNANISPRPILFNLPVGHGYDNHPLVLGGEYELKITAEKAQFSWLGK